MSDIKMLDRVLRDLGFTPEDLGTFIGRKRIQKVVYLLQQFGLQLGFKYSWYIHGPYSAELTKVIVESESATKRREEG